MTRGEVYYIENPKLENGCMKLPDRPAVIVSNDMLNALNSFVKVCYMTVKPVSDMPTHVTTRCTGCVSNIMCESLDNVHISHIGMKAGELTEAEMLALDAALAISLGLDFGGTEPKVVEKPVEKIVMREPTPEELEAKARELMKINDLLEKGVINDAAKAGILPKDPAEEVLKNIEVETMLDICKRDLLRTETERDIFRELYSDMLNTLTVLAKGEKA